MKYHSSKKAKASGKSGNGNSKRNDNQQKNNGKRHRTRSRVHAGLKCTTAISPTNSMSSSSSSGGSRSSESSENSYLSPKGPVPHKRDSRHDASKVMGSTDDYGHVYGENENDGNVLDQFLFRSASRRGSFSAANIASCPEVDTISLILGQVEELIKWIQPTSASEAKRRYVPV